MGISARKKADLLPWSTRYVGQRKKNYWRDDTGRHEKRAAATLIARPKQMKDFTIGQVRNDVIEHGDNYYRFSGPKQADYNQFPSEGRWISRFFPPRDTFVSITTIIVFQSAGIHLSLLSRSVLIACLIPTGGVPREFISPEDRRHFRMCENKKNTISSASASPRLLLIIGGFLG